MNRLYNRQAKKLAKLQSRADIDTQRANVQKYNRRAGIAAGVGLGAAGVAVGSKALNSHLKGIAKKAIADLTKQQDDRLSASYDFFSKTLGSDSERAHYAKYGHYSDSAWDKIYKDKDQMNETWDKLGLEKNKIRSDFNRGAQLRKVVSYGAAGVAAISAGVAVYNKVQAHMAKTRMTEVGHNKAVARVKAQVSKMEKMFTDTPYSELIGKKPQNRNKKKA